MDERFSTNQISAVHFYLSAVPSSEHFFKKYGVVRSMFAEHPLLEDIEKYHKSVVSSAPLDECNKLKDKINNKLLQILKNADEKI